MNNLLRTERKTFKEKTHRRLTYQEKIPCEMQLVTRE